MKNLKAGLKGLLVAAVVLGLSLVSFAQNAAQQMQQQQQQLQQQMLQMGNMVKTLTQVQERARVTVRNINRTNQASPESAKRNENAYRYMKNMAETVDETAENLKETVQSLQEMAQSGELKENPLMHQFMSKFMRQLGKAVEDVENIGKYMEQIANQLGVGD